eukprot:TRINITY_DN1884_c0_g1_i1.p1 TRINITY_DN1884_c0_g1~~TRINITY_DN1884_c0_g1_i1.p1  ORF type:complete len:685 (-),score=165.52 TRINITY_DN1884_c0_g1_i1:76-2130(-)
MVLTGKEWGSAQQVLDQAAALAAKAAGSKELLSLAKEELAKARSSGSRQAEAVAQIAAVEGHLGAGDYDAAEKEAAKALLLFKELGLGACRESVSYAGSAAAAQVSAAVAEQREAALRLVRSKLLLFREIGVPKGEVAALLKVADEQLNTGKPEPALLLGKEAQKVARRVGNKDLEATVMDFVAEAFLKAALPAEAEKAAAKASTLAKGAGNVGVQAAACLRLAEAHLASKAGAPALEAITEAITLFQKAGDKEGEAAAQTTKALAEISQGEHQEAVSTAKQAAGIFKEQGNKVKEAQALLAAAEAHEKGGDKEAGLKLARSALILARAAKDSSVETQARDLCSKLRQQPSERLVELDTCRPLIGVTKPITSAVPGVSGPASLKKEPFTGIQRLCGPLEQKRLSGMIAVVTGASRGIGKGISLSLAEAGAIVYVTGRSSPGKETDILLMGTVDETASQFNKLGGTGVAVHVDHAQDTQNAALAKLIGDNHGRLDLCVNSAFYIPKPDMIFFSTPIWNQPMRFLNEQTTVGGFNHAAQTLMFLPYLRRGKGVVVNVSSWGSQMNIPVFPVSYYVNKAAFDRTTAALAERLKTYGVYCLTIWPGSVKSERSIMGAKRTAARLIDLETTRFTGQAIVELTSMRPEALRVYATKHRTISSADICGWETDGYFHQGDLHTFSTGGRCSE